VQRTSVYYYGSDEMQRHVYVENKDGVYTVCRRIYNRKWGAPAVLFTSKHPTHLQYKDGDLLPRIVEVAPSDQESWIVALERIAHGAKFHSCGPVKVNFTYTMLAKLLKSCGKAGLYPACIKVAGSNYASNPALKVHGSTRDWAILIHTSIDSIETKANELLSRVEERKRQKTEEFVKELSKEDLLLLWEEE
jgi:hypothetical protein